MRIYAGIDRKNRTRTMTLMSRQVSDLKRGKFTSEGLRLTKEMIINAAKLSQDRPGTLIERSYLQSTLGKQFLSIDNWIQAIQLVTKEEIMLLPNHSNYKRSILWKEENDKERFGENRVSSCWRMRLSDNSPKWIEVIFNSKNGF